MKKLFLLLFLIPFFSNVDAQITTIGIKNNAFYVGDSAWTDLRAPATTIRQGVSTKPDFNVDSLTLDFPYNDSGEVAYIVMQLPHDWVTGSEIRPHIHYLQNESDIPVFVIMYRWFENGQATGAYTRLESNGVVFSYTSGSIMQIMQFPSIDGSGIVGVSSCLQIKLYREEEATITSDVQVVEFDIHYRVDSNGSDSEYIKSWD